MNSGKVGDLVVYDSLALLYSAPSLLSAALSTFNALPWSKSGIISESDPLFSALCWHVSRFIPLFVGKTVALFRTLSAVMPAHCRQDSCAGSLLARQSLYSALCWHVSRFIPLFVGTSAPLLPSLLARHARSLSQEQSCPLFVGTKALLFPSLSARESLYSALCRH